MPQIQIFDFSYLIFSVVLGQLENTCRLLYWEIDSQSITYISYVSHGPNTVVSDVRNPIELYSRDRGGSASRGGGGSFTYSYN